MSAQAALVVALPLGTDSLVESYRLPRLTVLCVLTVAGLAKARLQVDRLVAASLAFVCVAATLALGVDDPASAVERLALISAGLLTVSLGQTDDEALQTGAALGVLAVAGLTIIEACGGLKLSVTGLGPSGGAGSRNAAAHLFALGLPLLWARSRRSRWWLLGLAVVMLALVWTRSRAGWLAALAVGGVVSAQTLRRATSWRDWAAPACALLGVAVALCLPNALRWRSNTPYTDSARRLFALHEGSGAGRVRQASANLSMLTAHPLGVGAGQWRVEYPRFAAREDLDRSGFEPCAREPLNDLTAVPAELGLVGLGCLVLWLVWWWRVQAPTEVQLATIACLAVLMVGDSVLTSAPTVFLAALGFSAPRAEPGRPLRWPVSLPLAALLTVGAIISVTRTFALAAVVSASVTPQALARAAWVAPFEYRARLSFGEYLAGVQQCDDACTELRAAARLRPRYDAPRSLATACQSCGAHWR